MYHNIAMKIINDIFLVKYIPTIKENKNWYENLNRFIATEWVRIQESEQIQSQLIDDAEVAIITADAMQVLLCKLKVDEDEFDSHEHHIDWVRFDNIIEHYIHNR
jgi:predicted ATP-dependent Lon-type protease